MEQQLQRELQSVTAKLSALNAGGAKTKRRRKRGKATLPLTGASQAGVVSVSGGGGRKRKSKQTAGLGTITFVRREMLLQVAIAKNGGFKSGYAVVKPSSFGFLSKFSMFDKVQWNKFNVFYKPGVGSTFNGFLAYGVEYGKVKTVTSRGDVSALTPNMSHALWFDGESRPMVVPQARLKAKSWYTPASSEFSEQYPASIVYAAESAGQTNASDQVVGELWVDYSVTLTGTAF